MHILCLNLAAHCTSARVTNAVCDCDYICYIYYVYTGPNIPLNFACKLVVTASALPSRHEHTTSGNALDRWHNRYQNMLANKQQQHYNSGYNSKVVSPSRLTASKNNQNSHDATYSNDYFAGTLQLLVAIKWTEPCCNGSRITSYQIQRYYFFQHKYF
jgi:hypothetical protein